MGRNLVEKILASHLAEEELRPGAEIALRIDQTLTQDATGTMAYLQYEALGAGPVKTELSVSYVDHGTAQSGPENADDHRYLQSVASKYGVLFSRAGNGICHQVHLERFARPGKTLLGSDSHTPTAGGMGMIAIGAGGLDVALAMAGRPFRMIAPAVVRVGLEGKLRPWVSAKDVILHLVGILTTTGNAGAALEYAGGGVAALSIPERATIANMGAETGVTTSVFPSDKATLAFLKAQGRAEQWQPLAADPDAQYARRIDVDLSEIVPMAAGPHSPGNVEPVSRIAGLPVDQVAIGSCTNGSYRDLTMAAAILKGKRIAPAVSLIVAPGSRQALKMAMAGGALADLVASGARIAETACGFCIGVTHAPAGGAVCLRTSNRNFEGRSGTKDARVYLVGVETAAASALCGAISDPRELGEAAYPEIKTPRRFDIDEGMILKPAPDPGSVEILRGPSIGAPPAARALPEDLSGEVAIKLADGITTDHIMPAGPRLKHRSNIPEYSRFVFEGVDPAFAGRATRLRDAGKAVLIVAGRSYGQGSSREHAAMCPMYLGVRAVVAKSFERIHGANLVNFGIAPLLFAQEADYGRIEQGDEVEIRGLREGLETGRVGLRNKTRHIVIPLRCELTPRQRETLIAGGALNLAKGK